MRYKGQNVYILTTLFTIKVRYRITTLGDLNFASGASPNSHRYVKHDDGPLGMVKGGAVDFAEGVRQKMDTQFLLSEIELSRNNYFKLVVLVGQSRNALDLVAHQTGELLNSQPININETMGALLLDTQGVNQRIRASRILGDLIDSASSEEIVLYATDILFTPSLKIDVLSLLKGLARNKVMVATWPGQIRGGKLHHAEEWHPEYQAVLLADVRAVAVDR